MKRIMIAFVHTLVLLAILSLEVEFSNFEVEQTGGTYNTDRNLACVPIGTGEDDGFFSLRVFDKYLFVGGFGYNSKQFIYKYPPFEPMNPGVVVTESIGRFSVFKGHLYANTENKGLIFRTKDATGENWEKVFDLEQDRLIGCGLAIFDDYLYAVNYDNKNHKNGRIFRTTDGEKWEKVYDSGESSQYIREIVTYDDSIYAFTLNEKEEQPGYFKSTNGTDWKWFSCDNRLFRGYVWSGKLWIGTSQLDNNNDKPSSLLWFDGTKFNTVQEFDSMGWVSDVRYFNDYLYVTTTVQWKGHQGGATLYRSSGVGDGGRFDEKWESVCVFNETESWNLEEYDGSLYISTKQDGAKGKMGRIYRLEE